MDGHAQIGEEKSGIFAQSFNSIERIQSVNRKQSARAKELYILIDKMTVSGSQKQDAKSILDEMQWAGKEQRVNIKKLATAMESIKKERDEKILNLRISLENLRVATREQDAKIKELGISFSAMGRIDKEQVETSRDNMVCVIDEQHAKIKELQISLDKMTRLNHEQNGKIKDLEAARTMLEHTNKEQDAEIKTLATSFGNMEHINQNLDSKIKELKQENTSLKDKYIEQLEHRVAAVEENIQKAKEHSDVSSSSQRDNPDSQNGDKEARKRAWKSLRALRYNGCSSKLYADVFLDLFFHLKSLGDGPTMAEVVNAFLRGVRKGRLPSDSKKCKVWAKTHGKFTTRGSEDADLKALMQLQLDFCLAFQFEDGLDHTEHHHAMEDVPEDCDVAVAQPKTQECKQYCETRCSSDRHAGYGDGKAGLCGDRTEVNDADDADDAGYCGGGDQYRPRWFSWSESGGSDDERPDSRDRTVSLFSYEKRDTYNKDDSDYAYNKANEDREGVPGFGCDEKDSDDHQSWDRAGSTESEHSW